MTRVHYHLSSNFGDLLTPWIIEQITGSAPVYVPADCPEPFYTATGSILESLGPAAVVWGVGVATKWQQPPESKKIRGRVLYVDEEAGPTNFGSQLVTGELRFDTVPRAVRGAEAAKHLRATQPYEPLLADPGLLLSRLSPFHYSERGSSIGIIYSWVEKEFVEQNWKGDENCPIMLIPAELPVDEFIQRLNCCAETVSSTLHGLVASVSYGIRTRWVDFEGEKKMRMGDGTKYRDFLGSLGSGEPANWCRTPVNLSQAPGCDLTHLPVLYATNARVIEMQDALMRTCPLPGIKEEYRVEK